MILDRLEKAERILAKYPIATKEDLQAAKGLLGELEGRFAEEGDDMEPSYARTIEAILNGVGSTIAIYEPIKPDFSAVVYWSLDRMKLAEKFVVDHIKKRRVNPAEAGVGVKQ